MYRFRMCWEIFHGNSTILPKLSFFYSSVKAVSIGIPGCFRIPANADIRTRHQQAMYEIFLKSLLFKAGRTKRRPKSSLTREQISIDSKVAFLLV